MKSIKILGTGCAKCNKLYELADQAASELGLEYQLEKVTEFLACQPPLAPERVEAILSRVRERQAAVGYGGDYAAWLEKVAPAPAA